MSIYIALAKAQNEIVAQKLEQANHYNFRNLESINGAAKRPLLENGLVMNVTYNIVESIQGVGRFVVEGVASVFDDKGESITSKAYAAVTESKATSLSQAIGAAQSYAGKYAACALLAIDDEDTLPPDDDKLQQEKEQRGEAHIRDPDVRELRNEEKEEVDSVSPEMMKELRADLDADLKQLGVTAKVAFLEKIINRRPSKKAPLSFDELETVLERTSKMIAEQEEAEQAAENEQATELKELLKSVGEGMDFVRGVLGDDKITGLADLTDAEFDLVGIEIRKKKRSAKKKEKVNA